MPNQSRRLFWTYGIHWDRHLVFWGSPGKKGAGRLWGRKAKKPTAEAVDFRNQGAVYFLYDNAHELIYVGQAVSLFRRLKQHHQSDTESYAKRWRYFSWFGTSSVAALKASKPFREVKLSLEQLLLGVEGLFVEICHPPFNSQGGQHNAGLYEQVMDSRLRPRIRMLNQFPSVRSVQWDNPKKYL